jgi:hypothetical protein
MACPTLNALLLACAGPPLGEPWDVWYYGTRLVLADWLDDRGGPGDRLAASLVRQARPAARGPVRVPWQVPYEVDAVELTRRSPPGASGPLRVDIEGAAPGDSGWLRLTDDVLLPDTRVTVDCPALRPFQLKALRVTAWIDDESLVAARVWVCRAGQPRGERRAREEAVLTHHVARGNCRRGVLALFAGTRVRLPVRPGHPRATMPAAHLVPVEVAPDPAAAVD